jgi:hypothetical protein
MEEEGRKIPPSSPHPYTILYYLLCGTTALEEL